jgi:hypothetical protein
MTLPPIEGRFFPEEYLVQSESPDDHNEAGNKRLAAFVKYGLKSVFPGAALSRSNLPPNPERPFHILEKDATGLITKDIKFSLQACPRGLMARFPLDSPVIREYAARADEEDMRIRMLNDPRVEPWCMGTDYVTQARPTQARPSFRINYVSTGPGPDAKSMVFHTLTPSSLGPFLDEVLQTGTAIRDHYNDYARDPNAYLARRRAENDLRHDKKRRRVDRQQP